MQTETLAGMITNHKFSLYFKYGCEICHVLVLAEMKMCFDSNSFLQETPETHKYEQNSQGYDNI